MIVGLASSATARRESSAGVGRFARRPIVSLLAGAVVTTWAASATVHTALTSDRRTAADEKDKMVDMTRIAEVQMAHDGRETPHRSLVCKAVRCGSRVPGSDLSAHAGVRRVRNYARGGGSSGGVLIDAGACTTRHTSSCEMTGAGPSAIALESIATGAHGAMPLQFAGAHGMRQGS